MRSSPSTTLVSRAATTSSFPASITTRNWDRSTVAVRREQHKHNFVFTSVPSISWMQQTMFRASVSSLDVPANEK
jgi:hypothetical protein